MRKLMVSVVFFLLTPTMTLGQNVDPRYAAQGYLVFGLGPGTKVSTHPLVWQVGGGGEGFLYKGLGIGAEAGYVYWSRSIWPVKAVTASADLSYHFGRRARRGNLDPFVLWGGSIVGPAGGGRGEPAVNFGGGTNVWLGKHAGLRLEFRDIAGASYWNFDEYLSWRVGVTFR